MEDQTEKKELPPIPTMNADESKNDIGTLVKAACLMIADNSGVQKFETVVMNARGQLCPIAVVVMPDVKRAKDWIKDPTKAPQPVKRTKLIEV